MLAFVAVMAKIADMEGRSSFAWGALTLVLCQVFSAIIPIPFAGLLVGFVAAFLIMFAAKIIQK